MPSLAALAMVCLAANWCREPTGAGFQSSLCNGGNPPLVIEDVLVVDPQKSIDEQLPVRNLLVSNSSIGKLEPWNCCNLASRANQDGNNLGQPAQIGPHWHYLCGGRNGHSLYSGSVSWGCARISELNPKNGARLIHGYCYLVNGEIGPLLMLRGDPSDLHQVTSRPPKASRRGSGHADEDDFGVFADPRKYTFQEHVARGRAMVAGALAFVTLALVLTNLDKITNRSLRVQRFFLVSHGAVLPMQPLPKEVRKRT